MRTFIATLTLAFGISNSVIYEPAAAAPLTKGQRQGPAENSSRNSIKSIESEPANFTRARILSWIEKAGCPRSQVLLVAKSVSNDADADFFAACRDQCGIGGCTYSVFLQSDRGLYRLVGLVDGVCTPKSSQTSIKDIECVSRNGADQVITKIWKYESGEYR